MVRSDVPIGATEEAISNLARSFTGADRFNLEVFGYWIGLTSDRLTHLILPEYIMGISRDRNDAMTYATNTLCRSLVMFAVQADSDELGVMVHTCAEDHDGSVAKGSWVFIPFSLLILNRPIAAYLTARTRSDYFAGKPAGRITASDIAGAIRGSGQKKQTHLLDERRRWTRYEFLPTFNIMIDAFVSSRCAYPMNPFIINSLGANRFSREVDDATEYCYGRVHIHYAYRDREIRSDPLINALYHDDRGFFTLMTPVDAVSMLESAQALREISDLKLSMRQHMEAIVALDPESLEVVGRSYFDLDVLETAVDKDRFKRMATRALRSRDVKPNRSWFSYVRELSTAERPGGPNAPGPALFP